MIVSAIVAMGKNRVIGVNNQLPWHLPLEFKHFKQMTLGHTVITGRKSFESVGAPLPGRCTIIVTRNTSYQRHDCRVVHDFATALGAAKAGGEREVFVIGGADIYRLCLPYLHRLYRTTVDYQQPGDVYFPQHDHYPWRKVESYSMGVTAENSLAWVYELLEKEPQQT